MKQEQRKTINSLLPSLPNQNLFQLIVAGNQEKVKRFWKFIEDTSEYRLTNDFHRLFEKLDDKADMHIVMQIEETSCSPTSQNRAESKVQIRDEHGKNIVFTLMDTQIIEMSDGMIYIRGKNFDIFADPGQDREVVDCTVVDTEEMKE